MRRTITSNTQRIKLTLLLSALLTTPLCTLANDAAHDSSHGASHHDSHEATKPPATTEAPHAANVHSTEPNADHKNSPTTEHAKKGTRLENNEEAMEKIRQILQNGIPERATLQLKVNTGEGPPAHGASNNHSANDHGTSTQHGSSAVHKPSGAPTNPVDTHRASANAKAHGSNTAHANHWDYEGAGAPAHWAELDPANAACGQGKHQSPIHITGHDAINIDLEPIIFQYGMLSGSVVNNGHTVQVNTEGAHSIAVRGQTFHLVQFHFHHPAEHRVDQKQSPMVMHFVHRSNEGNLAVVGVLIDEGEENLTINHLWSRLPFLDNQAHPLAEDAFELSSLLPTDQRYYIYSGSLTTPPCSENVLWMVLKTPITLSKGQIQTFSRLYPANNRPVQPINRRLIQASK